MLPTLHDDTLPDMSYIDIIMLRLLSLIIIVHVHLDGTLMDPSERSSYYWLSKTVFGEAGNMPPTRLVPCTIMPFSTTPPGVLVSLLQCAMKHNFLSSMLVLSGGIMALHYEKIREVFAGCPVVVATGDPETGQSTSIKVVAALYG